MLGVCTFTAAILGAATAAAGAPWVTSADYGRLQVVVADTATDAEKWAAEEFRAHWEKATGHAIPVRNRSGRGITVWIGRDGVPAELLAEADLDGLGTDGIYLRTFDAGPNGQPALVLSGGRERGTAYAAGEFLERALGIRWLTPTVTHVPKAPGTIAHIDYRYTPQLLRRRMSYSETNGWAAQRNGGLYGQEHFSNMETRFRLSSYPLFGGKFVHSSFTLLPPREYFLEHPEYYSEINGKRRGPVIFDGNGTPEWVDHLSPNEMGAMHPDLRTQLCYSNPDVAEELTKVLRERMAASPDRTIWSISQEDWDHHCQCAECAAIDAREGTPMGSLLTGINRVADNLRAEFPNNYIETLAYAYSRPAPRHLKPADNVVISLCNIEVNMILPMNDKGDFFNRGFGEDFDKWGGISKNILFWDYPDNCLTTHLPYPNFHVIQKNMQLWAEAHAMGGYLCGGELPEIGLGALRAYLLAKLMWNPWCDYDALMTEFLEIYYGKAAPHVREYIDWTTQYALESGALVHVHDFGDWISHDMMVKADEILRRAVEAADTPETRLRAHQLWVINQFPAMCAQPKVTVHDGTIEVRRPETIGLEAILREMDHWGLPTYRDEPLSQRLGGWAFPEKQPRYDSSEIVVLENRHTEVWVAPALSGSVIRWRDKATGEELFGDVVNQPEPYRFITYQEWATGGSDAPETPVNSTYEVVEHVPNQHITLRATTDNGLTLERTLRLRPRGSGIDVTVTVTNGTDEAQPPRVKLHPEFHSLDTVHPRIMIEQDGEWIDHNAMRRKAYQLTDGRAVPVEGSSRWAYHVPGKDLAVVNSFDPENVSMLFYFVGIFPYRYHVNLELFMDDSELAPGESRSIQSGYEVVRGMTF